MTDSPHHWPTALWSRGLLAIAIVVVGSIVIGALTSPAQQYLPVWINSLANSAGGWSMFAFLLVWLSRARRVLGAILGAASFVLMVQSYEFVTALRGFPAPAPFTSIWILVGLVAGPIIGIAAALTRYASRPWAIVGVAALSCVLFAEGTYGLAVVSNTTSPAYWVIELVLGVGFLVIAIIRTRGRRATG